MDIWIGLAVGVFIGGLISLLVFMGILGNWYIGYFREDHSIDGEAPYYFMEISEGAYRRVMVNRFVLLRVKREDYLPKNTNAVMDTSPK